LLGVLQGLTEFLPVSSSGHLVLAESLLGIADGDATVEVALHVGTLLAVLVYLRRDIAMIGLGVAGVAQDRAVVAGSRRLFLGLLAAAVPVAVVGILFKDQVEAAFGSLWITAFGFFVSAAMVTSSQWLRGRRAGLFEAGPLRGLLIGIAQVVAMLPGVSRSGTTIVAGMATGLEGAAAGRFSFLLAAPVIGGATLLKLGDLAALPDTMRLPLAIGVAVSFLTGLAALWMLTLILKRGRLHWFALYLVPLGIFTLWVASGTGAAG
jgi:undecaprenyl-diphosphatase